MNREECIVDEVLLVQAAPAGEGEVQQPEVRQQRAG